MTTQIKNTERVVFGFWIYILSDSLLFAGLFATFAVLRFSTAGGPGIEDFLNLPFVLAETLILLFSSFMMGLALTTRWEKSFLALTFLLGAAFLSLEVHEFAGLIAAGHGPSESAALSAFFVLVGVHGLHVAVGMLWMLVVMLHLLVRPLSPVAPKLRSLALFWHFLDIIWIFIFTVVYLFAAL